MRLARPPGPPGQRKRQVERDGLRHELREMRSVAAAEKNRLELGLVEVSVQLREQEEAAALGGASLQAARCQVGGR